MDKIYYNCKRQIPYYEDVDKVFRDLRNIHIYRYKEKRTDVNLTKMAFFAALDLYHIGNTDTELIGMLPDLETRPVQQMLLEVFIKAFKSYMKDKYKMIHYAKWQTIKNNRSVIEKICVGGV
jgi:hypothetical protein